MSVIEFPARITKASPQDQRDAVCTATGNQMLAAIAAKYPEIRLTSDEILSADARQVTVAFDRGAGEWYLSLRKAEQ